MLEVGISILHKLTSYYMEPVWTKSVFLSNYPVLPKYGSHGFYVNICN